MTATEQVIEALATYGPGVAALGVALRSWVNSRAAKNASAARVNDAIASQVELALAREKRLEDRIDALESGVAERDATIDVLRGATQDCERRHREAMRRIADGERRRERWEAVLRVAGIDLDGDDSGKWLERLGQLVAGNAAHERERRAASGTDG